MANKSSGEFCFWMVRPKKGGVKRIRLGRFAIIKLGVILGFVLGGALYIAHDYVQILLERGDTVYKLAKLVSDRQRLMAEREKLERRLSLLKDEHLRSQEFHSDIKSRMDQLHAVIEGSTALGLLQGNKIAPKSRLKELNEALGGAEVVCRKDRSGNTRCSSAARKSDVSIEEFKASLKPDLIKASAEDFSGERDKLIARLNRYLDVLRALPIGAPVRGKMTSGFGYRRSPFSHRGSFHEGIDISLPVGSPVHVTGDGIVLRAEWDGAYGMLVDVDHYDGIVSRYAHLSSAQVVTGQLVTRGMLIARSGNTGSSTGPHLHYEVLINGQPKNPTRFVQLAGKLKRYL